MWDVQIIQEDIGFVNKFIKILPQNNETPTPHKQKHVKWTNSYTFGCTIPNFGYKYIWEWSLWDTYSLFPILV